MRPLVTAQQIAFFAQNGYIELEGLPFDSTGLFSSAQTLLQTLAGTPFPRIPAFQLYTLGRDLWREDKLLQNLLLRTLAPIISSLIAKPLRLATDQWIPSGYSWERASAFHELFSIQGLAIGALFCASQVALPTRAPLGLLPLPKNPNSVLFLKPDLLLDWPGLQKSPATDLYLAAYAYTNAVYIHNPKDPSGNRLKQLGYYFGDPLQNNTHPLLSTTRNYA